MNLNQEVKYLRSQLKKHSDKKRAQGEKKYFKSSLKHYGVTVPTIRRITKTWIKKHPDFSMDKLVKLSQILWDTNWHEQRMLAVFLLEYKKNQLNLKHLPIVENMINTATGWAQLDGIAVWLVGAIIDKDKNTLEILNKWIKSDNFWVRRTAILAQIIQFRRGKGDFKLFKTLVIPQFQEGKDWSKEERFFIRKSIGWALRELAPQKPTIVFNFVKKYKPQMSGLTFREATRKLHQNMQNQLKN